MSSRVLIIDDDAGSALLLETMLCEHPGLDVRSVTDSRQAEHAFLDFEPDLVLLDLHMPPPDGLEVLRRLGGARTRMGFVPVIMLTADTSRIARNSALVLGADEFLTKPLDREEVLLRVRNLLRTRQLYADLERAKEALEQEPSRTPGRG